jgi:hypothetical protein
MTPKQLSETIKTIAVNAGAELVGFTPAHTLEADAPSGHKPSNLLPNANSIIILAGGNKLNEDRHYIREIGSLSTLTQIELKNSVKLERRRTRTCIQAVHDFLIRNGYKSAVETHGWYAKPMDGTIRYRLSKLPCTRDWASLEEVPSLFIRNMAQLMSLPAL